MLTMATPVSPDLSHVIVTTPFPIEVRRMAVHEPDHNLSATSQLPDEDKKLPRNDPVIATTSFPTHTKKVFFKCKRQTLQLRNF